MTDFTLDYSLKRPIRILQLTDMQTIDLTVTRNKTRDAQIKGAYFSDGEPEMETRTYGYVRELVSRTKPDLIVLTGDNVYGEFDDKGRMQLEMVNLMESFGIPWAPVFGNHDNESEMGVLWQRQTFLNAKNCLFSPGTVTGNSNFSILLTLEGKPFYTLFMLDTNGCHPVGNPSAPEEGVRESNVDFALLTGKPDIYPDQIRWFEETAKDVNLSAEEKVPSLAFFHIAIHAFMSACKEKYGYTKDVPMIADKPGDYGRVIEHFSDEIDENDCFFDTASRVGTVGMFVGHEHNNNASLLYRGVRLTFGVKTGRCTYYKPDSVGGTLIRLAPDGFMEVEAVTL